MAQFGMDWIRQVTDESLNEMGAMFERFMTTIGRAAEGFDQQATELRQRSMSMARETLANSMDFARRAINVRDPQELLQLQSEFLSKQAQALAEQSKQFNESVAQGAHQMGKFASQGLREASRQASEAA
jgi:phasin family protein